MSREGGLGHAPGHQGKGLKPVSDLLETKGIPEDRGDADGVRQIGR